MTNRPDKKRLRQILINKRNLLSQEQQLLHEQQVLHFIRESSILSAHKKFGLYFNCKAELPTQKITEMLWANDKSCFLPAIDSYKKNHLLLLFAPWKKQSCMVKNRYGITEVQCSIEEQMQANALDVVFMPLVGFDHQGNRLGMGGGFYDCTFADRNTWRHSPLLIGLAHSVQCATEIPSEPWDVKMDAVVTENGVHYF